MTSDLEPKYYYRYSQSLRSIGKNDKANEILDKLCQKPEMILDLKLTNTPLKPIIMKNNITLYMIFGSVFLFNCLAQANKASITDKNMDTTNKKLQKKTSKNVKSYHVEENINMKFGGYTTTYNVTDSSLVNSYDLGPNNTRVVTPKFEKK